jgi:hypothetical protein
MRTTRLINAGLVVALVSGAVAGPAAAVPALDHAPGNGAAAALHPEPITQIATLADGRPIPQPPTWPLHPKVIPPPPYEPPATLVVDHPASSFDWGAAAIGAATTLAVLAIALAAAVVIRRLRVGAPARLT